LPFHRFETREAVRLTPHLSSAVAPMIEGKYLYYCLNQKKAGTGSELHYHPNELLIFTLTGNVNAVIGKDRKIVSPGTFILIPPNVRHSLKATEDGPCAYLYIKDQTWSVVGIAANEARPEKAMSVEEVNEKYDSGEIKDRKGGGEEQESAAEMIIEGVPNCYYQVLTSLEQPFSAGRRIEWIEGELCAFGFFELPKGYVEETSSADHEYFIYLLEGALQATVGNEKADVTPGGIVEVPKGARYRLAVSNDVPTRLVMIRSTDFLEEQLTSQELTATG
jgi:quercetin dioxygenase-like cupin family protein